MTERRPLVYFLAALAAACLCGFVLPFSFAPAGAWFLQFPVFAFACFLLLKSDGPVKSFLTGWVFGIASLGSGVYWLYVSMHKYGGMAAPMAAFAVFMMGVTLGFFPALSFGTAKIIESRFNVSTAGMALFVFPALFTVFEWTRGWIFTGLPWLANGYAHTASPLGGFAPVTGVFGITFFMLVVSGALLLVCMPGEMPRKRRIIIAAAVSAAVFAAGYGCSKIAFTQKNGNPIHVRLLQGNVPQEFKFSRAQILAALDMYASEIRREKADLIVTPETAVPVFPQQLPPGWLASVTDYSAKSGTKIALGIPLADSMTEYANSVIVISPETAETRNVYRYDKHHLVPFGEFIPTGFRWFVRMMNIPLGDFKRGAEFQKPFPVKDQYVMPNICYEDIFAGEIAGQIRNEHELGRPAPTILMNMSNIAWFGDTAALDQHLQISVMRAIETGRPMMRSTNTGVTALIDPDGTVAARLPTYDRNELSVYVQGMTGLTPFVRFGNFVTVALSLLVLAAGLVFFRNGPGRKAKR